MLSKMNHNRTTAKKHSSFFHVDQLSELIPFLPADCSTARFNSLILFASHTTLLDRDTSPRLQARYKAGASDAELRRFLRTTVGSGASRRARCGAGRV